MQIRPEGMGISGRESGFVPHRRPILDMWIKVLNVVVRALTFGKARVVPMRKVAYFRNWDGIIR
jgi:hypothetical protein